MQRGVQLNLAASSCVVDIFLAISSFSSSGNCGNRETDTASQMPPRELSKLFVEDLLRQKFSIS